MNNETSRISSEVKGFVMWVTSIILFVAFLIWAFIPEPILASLGILYYPDKYWALAVPSYIVVIIMTFLLFNTLYFHYNTLPIDDFLTFQNNISSRVTGFWVQNPTILVERTEVLDDPNAKNPQSKEYLTESSESESDNETEPNARPVSAKTPSTKKKIVPIIPKIRTLSITEVNKRLFEL